MPLKLTHDILVVNEPYELSWTSINFYLSVMLKYVTVNFLVNERQQTVPAENKISSNFFMYEF